MSCFLSWTGGVQMKQALKVDWLEREFKNKGSQGAAEDPRKYIPMLK